MTTAIAHPTMPKVNYPGVARKIDKDDKLVLTRGIYAMECLWSQEKWANYILLPLNQDNQYNLLGVSQLEATTMKLHKKMFSQKVKDIFKITSGERQENVEDRHFVVGLGATQLIHAAIYACSSLINNNESPIVTSKLPGYLEYKDMVLTHHQQCRWSDIEDIAANKMYRTIEIVNSPSNPQGEVRDRVTKAKFIIHDRVNFWPWLMHENVDRYYDNHIVNDEISIFSYPKLLGFSGSRVGYAFVKDEKIAELMRKYIIINTHGLCTEGQLKCIKAVNFILDNTELYVKTVTAIITTRWMKVKQLFPVIVTRDGKRYELIAHNQQGPTLWLSLEQVATDGSITVIEDAGDWLMKHFNIECTYGSEYAAPINYARINLLAMVEDFQEFISRMKANGNREEEIGTMTVLKEERCLLG